MNNIEEVKKRFVEEVKLRAFDDKYIDKNEEREILQLALSQGVTVDAARAALMQVCDTNQFVLESAALSKAKDVIDTFAANDGKIDEKEFDDAVSILRKATNGKRTDAQLKRMVVGLIEDGSHQVKTGMFSNWYKRVKGEVGIA